MRFSVFVLLWLFSAIFRRGRARRVLPRTMFRPRVRGGGRRGKHRERAEEDAVGASSGMAVKRSASVIAVFVAGD
jgi:hypothetical protein